MFWRVLYPLSAFGLLATAAVAEDPANPPLAEEPAIVVPIELPWDTITAEWTERRYKVEAIGFKALDETGIDWLSDEVMVATFDAKGFTVSEEFAGVDSGETRTFDLAVSCIIGVRPGTVVLGKSSVCDDAGVPGPFSFRVEMFEKDRFGLTTFPCRVLPPAPGDGRHAGPHCVDDGIGDDFIGAQDLFFPVPDLEATLPNVGDSFSETVRLSDCQEGPDLCGDVGLSGYSFTYRTTRLPDVRTDFRSQLLAAMERSGIMVAGDAIAAGLRSLSAPRDRGAERELDRPERLAQSGSVAVGD
jgi:hypothetical protein